MQEKGRLERVNILGRLFHPENYSCFRGKRGFMRKGGLHFLLNLEESLVESIIYILKFRTYFRKKYPDKFRRKFRKKGLIRGLSLEESIDSKESVRGWFHE